jgi:hypothetical protein
LARSVFHYGITHSLNEVPELHSSSAVVMHILLFFMVDVIERRKQVISRFVLEIEEHLPKPILYNLEFKLPSILDHFHLPINPAALDINNDAAIYSKIHQAPLKPKRSNVPWSKEEKLLLLQMWNNQRSWEDIFAALPDRSEATIQVRCSTKLKKRPCTKAGR